MMPIYIVTSGEYDDYKIEAVFQDKNKAAAFVKHKNALWMGGGYAIESFETADDQPIPALQLRYRAEIPLTIYTPGKPGPIIGTSATEAGFQSMQSKFDAREVFEKTYKFGKVRNRLMKFENGDPHATDDDYSDDDNLELRYCYVPDREMELAGESNTSAKKARELLQAEIVKAKATLESWGYRER